MTSMIDEQVTRPGGNAAGPVFEAPKLVFVGSLHDLLAAGGTISATTVSSRRVGSTTLL